MLVVQPDAETVGLMDTEPGEEIARAAYETARSRLRDGDGPGFAALLSRATEELEPSPRLAGH